MINVYIDGSGSVSGREFERAKIINMFNGSRFRLRSFSTKVCDDVWFLERGGTLIEPVLISHRATGAERAIIILDTMFTGGLRMQIPDGVLVTSFTEVLKSTVQAIVDLLEPSIMNHQLVGTTASGDHILVQNPRMSMTKDQALVHAAWLVALADPSGDRFHAIFKRVRNT